MWVHFSIVLLVLVFYLGHVTGDPPAAQFKLNFQEKDVCLTNVCEQISDTSRRSGVNGVVCVVIFPTWFHISTAQNKFLHTLNISNGWSLTVDSFQKDCNYSVIMQYEAKLLRSSCFFIFRLNILPFWCRCLCATSLWRPFCLKIKVND